MKTGLTEYVLANLASMSTTMRRGVPVLLLYSSIEVVGPVKIAECRNYHVLPPAPDRDIAERTRAVLQDRGWNDHESPAGLDVPSISLSPPVSLPACDDRRLGEPEIVEAQESGTTSEPGAITRIEGQQHSVSSANQGEVILEHFDGFVDNIDGDTAYVTLRSREHGDELSGQYSASLLKIKGIHEQNRFLCKTVRIGNSTRVDIETVPKMIVTKEQLQEIDDEINRMLPDDDVDY